MGIMRSLFLGLNGFNFFGGELIFKEDQKQISSVGVIFIYIYSFLIFFVIFYEFI